MSNEARRAVPNGLVDDLTSSALLGIATGGRTMTGIAVLATTSSPLDTELVNRTFVRTPVRAALGLAALAEIIGDKLPQTPSRLSLPGLSGRLVFGGLCGAVVADRNPAPAAALAGLAVEDRPQELDPRVRTMACATAGVVAALAGSWLGAQWRSWAAPHRLVRGRRKTRMFVAALAEDAAVIGLASAGARR